MRLLMFAAALTVAAGTAVQAAENCPAFNKPVVKSVQGPAYVIDGDTVVVAGVRVRLKGVDAPERADKYGPDATNGMRAIVGDWLRCELTGEKTRKREVGYCVNAAGQDIGEAIVTAGAALACECYSDRYISFEQPEALKRLTRAPYCDKKKKLAQVLAVPTMPTPPSVRDDPKCRRIKCMYPDDRDSAGRCCGNRSAYKRPGGCEPKLIEGRIS